MSFAVSLIVCQEHESSKSGRVRRMPLSNLKKSGNLTAYRFEQGVKVHFIKGALITVNTIRRNQLAKLMEISVLPI